MQTYEKKLTYANILDKNSPKILFGEFILVFNHLDDDFYKTFCSACELFKCRLG